MKHRFESKDHPFIFHFFPAKINQVTQLYSRAAKLVEQLCFMGRLITYVCFKFHDDFVGHQQISGIIANDDAFELNLDFWLHFNLYIARLQLGLHRPLMNLFQKSETENIVNLKCRTNDLLCHRLK